MNFYTNKLAGLLAVIALAGCNSQKNHSDLKRVYSDAPVGTYKASFSLEDCNGGTFLQFMKDKIYPALTEESKNRTSGSHILGIKNGEGVELRLTEDVSTYHVKYKAHWEADAERSGRSFSAVGDNSSGNVEYVADASYAHYFDSFEKSLGFDKSFLKDFYATIFGIIASCDASSFANLNKYQKRLAADFVAVYIAEQYRHLLSGEGKSLGKRHNWDDALLHTTMMIAFHAGQNDDNRAMFYRGKFTNEVYNQSDSVDGETFCAYSNWNDSRKDSLSKRAIMLRDYWQFNRTCDRSGVNITRSDFEKLGYAISGWLVENELESTGVSLLEDLNEVRPELNSSSMYKNIAGFFISNDAPASLGDDAEAIVNEIVSFLMYVNQHAPEMTDSLLD